ncbi:LacI family DNA-binding transcriptional regulator [Streptomyces sp. NPDC001941]|uniref:LacI family DNA-binding transcriptional regulator n=1 Tax=Streptomyces sp. NPDC001941 TaxID=3154659 RepID=UPI003326CDD5
MPESPSITRPTLDVVAARAGVSRSTVSRVVNGGTGVRRQVMTRVETAIEELGYVPNRAARTLVTRRTGNVAVIIAEPEGRIFSDPYFGLQIRGISKELVAHDLQLVLLLAEEARDHERIERYLAGGHVDGALAFSVHRDDPLPDIVRRLELPTVYGGRPHWTPIPGEAALSYVDADNRGGARQAVQYLVSRGRQRIGHIAGPLGLAAGTDRLDGYRDVLFDGDPSLVVQGDFTEDSGERAMAELLDLQPDLDAVFVASDLMAKGALRALHERGRTVPGDVSVVGFDDLAPVSERTDPPLTTVRQDIEGMGRTMARLLVRKLRPHGSTAARAQAAVITATSLVRRGSA